MIQGQANRFVKRAGKASDTGFEVLKISDSMFMRELELSIQLGKWVLIENVPDTLDPALDPILLQQKIKSGSGQSKHCFPQMHADTFSFRIPYFL